MHYLINYACVSHIGRIRSVNQDNFICDGRHLDGDGKSHTAALYGTKISDEQPVFGVLDGMGGEECGEIAAYIAAQEAAKISIGTDAPGDLIRFCHQANDAICSYATANGVSTMGTTAAMLAFTASEIVLCNIGDSKVFRFCDEGLTQISKDHVAVSVFSTKPPLSQNLGIPPSDFIIDPYLSRGRYQNNDIYLICSDGLTDMISVDEIAESLNSHPIKDAASLLLDTALANGGKDNITIILCEVKRQSCWFSLRKRHIKRNEV